jgi:hypothetical protein
MPNLGEQFNNTYFEGDDKTTPYEDTHSYGGSGGTPRSKNPQGLLFHPDTATQSRNDPLYGSKQREQDIRQATSIGSSDIGNLHRYSVYGVVKKDIPQAIASTNISKTMLETNPLKVEGLRSTKRAGQYSAGDNKIVMNAYNVHGDPASHHDLGNTFTHEWGHKEDQDHLSAQGARTTQYNGKRLGYREIETAKSTTKGKVVTSPVFEGVADGYKDRFGTTTDFESGDEVNERYLNPIENDERVLDLKKTGGGYGVNFKGWRDRHEQALYAATRLHVAMHGKAGIESLPDMDALADKHLAPLRQNIEEKTGKLAAKNSKYATTARHLYLGQMVENHPHVREGLKQLGLGDVGEYSQAVHAHYTAPLPPKTQSTLPGYEKLAPTAPPLPKSVNVKRMDHVAVRQREIKEENKNSRPGVVRGKDGSLSIRLF